MIRHFNSLLLFPLHCHSLPIRIAGLHFINVIPVMDKLLALVKPFTKNELAQKLFVHETVRGLHGFAPADIFPKDYEGGMEDTMDALSGK